MAKSEVIKFNCKFESTTIPEFSVIQELNLIRKYLFNNRLFGINEDGISYGNISAYCDELMEYYSAYSNKIKFIITASGACGREKFLMDDYSAVVDYDFAKNYVHCIGKHIASSESLTHAAIYNSENKAKFVVHLHNQKIWSQNFNKLLTTDADIEYGTPELAFNIMELLRDSKNTKPVIILGGHPDGVLIWDTNTQSLLETIEELLNNH